MIFQYVVVRALFYQMVYESDFCDEYKCFSFDVKKVFSKKMRKSGFFRQNFCFFCFSQLKNRNKFAKNLKKSQNEASAMRIQKLFGFTLWINYLLRLTHLG